MDHLGLVESIDRLGESVVIAITHTADGGLDARLSEALGIADADILRTAIRMMHQPTVVHRSALMQGLLQCVEHEARMGCPRHPPTDDPPSIGIDQEGDVDETRPGRDVGKVRDPEPVRRRRVEHPVDMIGRLARARPTGSAWAMESAGQRAACQSRCHASV